MARRLLAALLPRAVVLGGRYHLVDPDTGAHLAALLPLDKQRNANGHRRAIRIAAADIAAQWHRACAS